MDVSVLENPEMLVQLAERHHARDTSLRLTAADELKALRARSSQYNPGHEIAEKSWAYWLVKKYCFSDFGTYAKHFDAGSWQAKE